MIIQEKDFKIIHEHGCFVLYLLKSKKEIKDDSSDNYKIGGYYTNLESAFKGVVKFRKDKKYPGKESSSDLLKLIKEYYNFKSKLKFVINKIYDPIIELKKSLIKYE